MEDLYRLAREFIVFYRVKPVSWLMITAGFLVFWMLLMRYLWCVPNEQSENNKSLSHARKRKRVAYGMNLLLVAVGFVLIVLVSFVRKSTPIHRVNLFPLSVLYGHKVSKEYWKLTIMNIVLYVPFACGMVFCLVGGNGKFQSHSVVATVLICFLISVAAEVLQYIRCSGYTEVDDVLMNTFGGAIGTLPYLVSVHTIPVKPNSCNNGDFSKEYME